MKLIILCLGVLSLVYEGDCAVTAWTTPVLATKDGTATLSYAETQGATIVTLAADTTADAFAIVSQPTTGKLALATGGALTLVAGFVFDYETEPTYVIVVTGANVASASTGTLTLTLSITDVAADANYDQSTTQFYRVDDAAAASTTVATITATGGTGTAYSLPFGNTNTDFAYSSAGVLTTAKVMGRAITPAYVLTLQALAAGVTSYYKIVVCVGTVAQCGGAAGLQISLAMLLVALITSRIK